MTDDGAWPSHCSQISRVRSRPSGPQFTNAPANLEEFEPAPDATFVAPSAEKTPASAATARIRDSPLVSHRLRRLSPAVRSVRNIVRPRQFPDKEGRQPASHFHGPLGREMARVELQWNIVCREFVAAAVAADGVVDRNV